MANQVIRITLKAYDHQLIDQSAKKIIETDMSMPGCIDMQNVFLFLSVGLVAINLKEFLICSVHVIDCVGQSKFIYFF